MANISNATTAPDSLHMQTHPVLCGSTNILNMKWKYSSQIQALKNNFQPLSTNAKRQCFY